MKLSKRRESLEYDKPKGHSIFDPNKLSAAMLFDVVSFSNSFSLLKTTSGEKVTRVSFHRTACHRVSQTSF